MNEKKKNNLINDEELDNVTGGVLLPEDKKWADELMWKIIEQDGSWNDVADQVFLYLKITVKKQKDFSSLEIYT